MNKCSISWKFDPQDDTCTVYLNNELIGEGKGSTNKASKELAARDALQKLQDQCYTVKIKAAFVSDSAVSPTALGISPAEDTVIKCDIGEQIMKLMGWGGGGLGAKQQGIVEPVSLLSNTGRGGLGLNDHTISDNAFRNKAADYIREWMRSDTDHDLVFTSDFTIAQRKILHEIALRFSLKSKSYGKGDDRHLVLSRKPSLWQIVEELARVGGATSNSRRFKFRVRGPSKFFKTPFGYLKVNCYPQKMHIVYKILRFIKI
ncbi:UNVERIFIED_CONTAM: hypothetical protein PYX00_003868 [Menopon gallinae]|uniref:R3H domain-containing protein n=1 Tax=Menopon gallinae TaxID=328185 RepID=A0AAW2I3M7_9NEOP